VEGVGNGESGGDRRQGDDEPRAELIQVLDELRAFFVA
jgi:hypothetical protein